jgi:putative membrane protein
MSQVIVFLALAFSIVIAVFAVQNTTPVAVTFLTFRAEAVAVSVLVLISAALGAAAMLLLGLAREISLRWRNRSVTNQLKRSQERIAQLEATQSLPAPAPSGAAAAAPDDGSPTVPLEVPPPRGRD